MTDWQPEGAPTRKRTAFEATHTHYNAFMHTGTGITPYTSFVNLEANGFAPLPLQAHPATVLPQSNSQYTPRPYSIRGGAVVQQGPVPVNVKEHLALDGTRYVHSIEHRTADIAGSSEQLKRGLPRFTL